MKKDKLSRKIMIGSLILTGTYAIWRYNIFGSVASDHLPLFIANKAIAWSSVILIGLSMTMGSMSRLWPKTMGGIISHRKNVGIYGFVLATLHLLLSLPLLTPAYFKNFFASDATFTFTAEICLLAGSIAWLILLFPAVTSVPVIEESMKWKEWLYVQSWNRGVLWISAAHVACYGASGWMKPQSWPGGLPPITLLSVLTVAGVFVVRYFGHRNLNRRKRVH